MGQTIFKFCAPISIIFLSWAMRAWPAALAVIRAGPSDMQYEVSPGQCIHRNCRILIRLMKGGRELDRLSIESHAASSDYKPITFDRSNGAADPLALTDAAKAFESGDDDDSGGVVVRRIGLTKDLAGVLIDLRYGFEEVKRSHHVVAALGEKLRTVWSEKEGGGPTYSTTVLCALPDGRDRLVYFSFFDHPDAGAADRVSISGFTYDSQSGNLHPDKTPIYGLTAGPYSSISNARAHRQRWRNCRMQFSVLPAKALDSSGQGYLAATFSSSPTNIHRAAGSLKHCAVDTAFSEYQSDVESLMIW